MSEAASIHGDLGSSAAAYVADGLPFPHPGIASMDAFGAQHDVPAATDIADALLVMGSIPDDFETLPRLTMATWRAIDGLEETGSRLHRLALADAVIPGLSEDLSVDAFLFEPYPPASVELRRQAHCEWRSAVSSAFEEVRDDASALVLGLASLPVRNENRFAEGWVAADALQIGRPILHAAREAGAREERRKVAMAETRVQRRVAKLSPAEVPKTAPSRPKTTLMVCPAVPKTSLKGREILRGHEHAIGHPLPLVETPDLTAVSRTLTGEFPFATDVIDRVLRHLIGKVVVRLPPLLIVGRPGAGKSRFVRRLGETLGVGVYRVDGSNDSGASYGGTERRWYSAEPCRPFMAISRYRQANPLMQIEEIDKASTRSDYGRLWDSLLAILEPETSGRFPDPALQVDLDLSMVSTVATANDVTWLPGPLLDRLTVIPFPEPSRRDLGALVPALLTDLARANGLDPRFHPPFASFEMEAVTARWSGGSIRRLRRQVEGVLRARDRCAAETPN